VPGWQENALEKAPKAAAQEPGAEAPRRAGERSRKGRARGGAWFYGLI